MLVDDEYMILKGLQQLLPWNDLGFEIVQTARNAKMALDYLEDNKIDLLITDITMPDKTGIEMVETAYQLGYDFSTIILTGYQEFEYAKKGLQLGVKNYLLKPVDKKELLDSVIDIKKELLQKSKGAEKEEIFQESYLLDWLNDELSEDNFEDIVQDYKLMDEVPYTVIQLRSCLKTLLTIKNYLVNNNQQMLVSKWMTSKEKLIFIYKGSSNQLKDFLQSFRSNIDCDDYSILVGETVDEWVDVYESYEKIKQLSALKKFYPDLVPDTSAPNFNNVDENSYSLLTFNKALTIGDSKTIEEELENVFEHITNTIYKPDDARYIAFLILADISRKYPQSTEEFYDEFIRKIRTSTTIIELEELLKNLLKTVKDGRTGKGFSENVQKIIGLIKDNYQEDLNLKDVANDMHLNVVYLGQMFKKETHYSFSQYLNQVRIKKAQQLLINSYQTINEISEEIGYNNTNYFSKMFKKMNGLSPKEFREKYHGDYSVFNDKENI